MQTTISDRWISNKKKTQQRLTQSLSLTRDSYENRIRSTTQTALSLNHLIQCLNFSTGKQLRAFILHQRRTTALFIHNFPQQCCFSIPHTFRNCPKKPRTSWRPRTSLPQDDDPSTTLSTLHFRPYFSWSPAQSNVLDRKVYICDGCLSCWYIPRRLVLTTQQLQQQMQGGEMMKGRKNAFKQFSSFSEGGVSWSSFLHPVNVAL